MVYHSQPPLPTTLYACICIHTHIDVYVCKRMHICYEATLLLLVYSPYILFILPLVCSAILLLLSYLRLSNKWEPSFHHTLTPAIVTSLSQILPPPNLGLCPFSFPVLHVICGSEFREDSNVSAWHSPVACQTLSNHDSMENGTVDVNHPLPHTCWGTTLGC